MGKTSRRVPDAAGLRIFRAKTVRLGASERAGFGLGPPALFSAQAGENRAPGGATGPFFRRQRKKNAWGGLLGARLEMPLVIKNSHTYCKYLQVIKTKHYAHAPRGIDW